MTRPVERSTVQEAIHTLDDDRLSFLMCSMVAGGGGRSKTKQRVPNEPAQYEYVPWTRPKKRSANSFMPLRSSPSASTSAIIVGDSQRRRVPTNAKGGSSADVESSLPAGSNRSNPFSAVRRDARRSIRSPIIHACSGPARRGSGRFGSVSLSIRPRVTALRRPTKEHHLDRRA